MIPQARRPRAQPAVAPLLSRLPPEIRDQLREARPYLRRVAMLMVLAAALGVTLALLIPGGHHS
jgi:hypothetical protein